MIFERQLLLALDQVGAHHAGDRIAVAEPDAVEPDMGRLQHQLLGMRSAAQEREVGGDGELEIRRRTLAFHCGLSTFIHTRVRRDLAIVERSFARLRIEQPSSILGTGSEAATWKETAEN